MPIKYLTDSVVCSVTIFRLLDNIFHSSADRARIFLCHFFTGGLKKNFHGFSNHSVRYSPHGNHFVPEHDEIDNPSNFGVCYVLSIVVM